MKAAWAAMMAERAVAGVASLVSLGLLARGLHPDAFGAWVLATAAWGVAESVRGGLVQGAFLRHHATAAPEDRGSWIVGAAALGALGSAAGGLVGVAVAAGTADPGAAALLRSTPLVLGAAWALGVPSLVLQARGRFGVLLAVRGVTSAVWLAMLVRLVAASDPSAPSEVSDASGALTAWIVAQLAGAVVAAAAALPGTPLPRAIRKPVRALAGHGGFALFATVGSSLFRSVDLAQIGRALGAAASGTYAQALRPVDLIEIPLQAASSVVAPKLAADAARSPADAANRAARVALAVAAGSFVLSAPVFVFAPAVLDALVGRADPMAVLTVRVLLLTNLLRPFDRLVGLTLDACGRPRENAVKVWVGLGFNLIVNVVALGLGGPFALPAVGAGSFVAVAASIGLGELLARRTLGVGVLSALPATARGLWIPAIGAIHRLRAA